MLTSSMFFTLVCSRRGSVAIGNFPSTSELSGRPDARRTVAFKATAMPFGHHFRTLINDFISGCYDAYPKEDSRVTAGKCQVALQSVNDEKMDTLQKRHSQGLAKVSGSAQIGALPPLPC
ncbi:MAG: hypothetical protein KFF50_03320 [Desulfatitalea sp.]|nr:hypothetical protein [Desulfatitalea sp.]